MNRTANPTPAPVNNPAIKLETDITFSKYIFVIITDDAQFGINPINAAIIGPIIGLFNNRCAMFSSPTKCTTRFIINVTNIINGKNVELGEYASKIRAIPFKSLGKENGLLLGVKVDEIEVSYQDMEHKIKDVIIGIYNGVLSRNGKYSGLIGLDIINSS